MTRALADAAPRTKLVEHFTMICDHEGCSRRTASLDARPFTRTTTCRRHRPESGYVIQEERQHSVPTHGYRERAADIRAMDSHRCVAHGDLAIYCGCRS